MSTTIMTVDDDLGFRDILKGLLGQDTRITVIGEADNGEDAVRRTRELHPDVVLMDITMPRVNGFDATRRIKAYRPQTKVIILTVHADYEQAALGNGADAFIAKKRLGSDLLPTIQDMMDLERESAPKSEASEAILVIDDDREFRGLTAAYLRANLLNAVIEERASAEAQALEPPAGLEPSVVVVDAEHDDPEFLNRLRRRFPGLSIIALTPTSTTPINTSALVAGADAWVAKNRIAVDLVPAITLLTRSPQKCKRALDVAGEL